MAVVSQGSLLPCFSSVSIVLKCTTCVASDGQQHGLPSSLGQLQGELADEMWTKLHEDDIAVSAQVLYCIQGSHGKEAAYIGQTKRFQHRMSEHCRPRADPEQRSALQHAIQKHGQSNFYVQIRGWCTGALADSLEIALIRWNASLVTQGGYNVAVGGRGASSRSYPTKLDTIASMWMPLPGDRSLVSGDVYLKDAVTTLAAGHTLSNVQELYQLAEM